MSEEAKWYVLHTYSNYEDKVAGNIAKVRENRHLEDFIKEIRVPTETVLEVRESGETKEVVRKLYPGYVIVKMIVTDESWYAVRNIRGCTGFVGTTTDPIPLSDEEVAKLGVEKRTDEGSDAEKVTLEVPYQTGDSVKIIDGPLDGFIGTVIKLDLEAGLITINVSMFGEMTPAELKINQVASVE